MCLFKLDPLCQLHCMYHAIKFLKWKRLFASTVCEKVHPRDKNPRSVPLVAHSNKKKTAHLCNSLT